jgi:type II secretory pathway component PulJ
LRTSTATSSERGGLLLEALLALSLTAIVLSGVYTAVVRAADARARAVTRGERDAAARAALLAVAAEVEAALAPDPSSLARRFVVTAPRDQTPWGELRFAAVPRGDVVPSSGGDARSLVYRVEGAPPAGTLGRREASLFAAGDAEPVPMPLVEGVRRFTVRCLGDDGWHDTWDRALLPRAVEVALEIEDGGLHTTALSIVATPALGPEAG